MPLYMICSLFCIPSELLLATLTYACVCFVSHQSIVIFMPLLIQSLDCHAMAKADRCSQRLRAPRFMSLLVLVVPGKVQADMM